jgi:hypothetical protein
MAGLDELLPPAHVVHERLSVNQRERRVLRTLLKLIYRDEDEAIRRKLQAESRSHRGTEPR